MTRVALPEKKWSAENDARAREAGFESWQAWAASVADEKELARMCGARAKSTQAPCRLPPVRGRDRCSKHGGRTPAGAASPHAKHLTRSRFTIPRFVRETVELSREVERLLSSREQIALLDGLEEDIRRELDGADREIGEVGAVEALERLRTAFAPEDPDPAEVGKAFRELEAAVRGSDRKLRATDRLFGVYRMRDRLVRTEIRREDAEHERLHRDEVADIARRIVGVHIELLRRYVPREKLPEALNEQATETRKLRLLG